MIPHFVFFVVFIVVDDFSFSIYFVFSLLLDCCSILDHCFHYVFPSSSIAFHCRPLCYIAFLCCLIDGQCCVLFPLLISLRFIVCYCFFIVPRCVSIVVCTYIVIACFTVFLHYFRCVKLAFSFVFFFFSFAFHCVPLCFQCCQILRCFQFSFIVVHCLLFAFQCFVFVFGCVHLLCGAFHCCTLLSIVLQCCLFASIVFIVFNCIPLLVSHFIVCYCRSWFPNVFQLLFHISPIFSYNDFNCLFAITLFLLLCFIAFPCLPSRSTTFHCVSLFSYSFDCLFHCFATFPIAFWVARPYCFHLLFHCFSLCVSMLFITIHLCSIHCSNALSLLFHCFFHYVLLLFIAFHCFTLVSIAFIAFLLFLIVFFIPVHCVLSRFLFHYLQYVFLAFHCFSSFLLTLHCLFQLLLFSFQLLLTYCHYFS